MKEIFLLQGNYDYSALPSGKGTLTGRICVAEDGRFEGPIRDHQSRTPDQSLRGVLTTENNLDTLSFIKFPPSENLANLFYVLHKPHRGSWEGTYEGSWRVLPVKVEFAKDRGVFICTIDRMLAQYDIGDSASIKVSRTS